MYLHALRVDNLRLIESIGLELGPRWNVFTGENGAGKTTLLEAAFLLSHGRSFRTAAKEALVRRGSPGFSVYGELRSADAENKVGLSRVGSRLEARLNGETVPAADLMRRVAVVCFEPGSHELMSGPSDERRRFLDWGVFHVEHGFLASWRRYQRALKQRNGCLRSPVSDEELDAWDNELVLAAGPLTDARHAYFERLAPMASALLADVLPELGAAELRFEPGYANDAPFEEILRRRRDRDRLRGYSGAGPHRADWQLSFERAPRRDQLSRGQEKLAAFSMVMAQAGLYARVRNDWPVLCFDDLASEVDARHQEKVVAVASATGAQILLTGTHAAPALSDDSVMFHVEQGRVGRLL